MFETYSSLPLQRFLVATFGFLAVVVLSVGTAVAGDKQQQAGMNVVVQIRTIKALEPKPTDQVQNASHIDERLEDLRGKLDQINYLSFKLISNDEVVVPFRKKQSIPLKGGTILTVRPLYFQENRVGMWLKWIDKSGSHVLLDTRMHFSPDDSMLTGTDSPDNCGVILAIKAKPEP